MGPPTDRRCPQPPKIFRPASPAPPPPPGPRRGPRGRGAEGKKDEGGGRRENERGKPRQMHRSGVHQRCPVSCQVGRTHRSSCLLPPASFNPPGFLPPPALCSPALFSPAPPSSPQGQPWPLRRKHAEPASAGSTHCVDPRHRVKVSHAGEPGRSFGRSHARKHPQLGGQAPGEKSRDSGLTLNGSYQQGYSTIYMTHIYNQVVCKGFAPARGEIAIRPPTPHRFRREAGAGLLWFRAEAYSYPSTTRGEKSPISGMDSDLEAFSHNPADGSVAALPGRTAAKTNYLNQRFLSY